MKNNLQISLYIIKKSIYTVHVVESNVNAADTDTGRQRQGDRHMTKTQVEQLAKDLVAKNADVQGRTVAELEERDYAARRTDAAAHDLHKEVNLHDVPVKWTTAFHEAINDAIYNTWSRKLKKMENKRSAWKSAISGMTSDQATAKIKGIVDSFHLRGMREFTGHCVEVERTFTVDARLYIRLDADYDSRTYNPDDEKQSVTRYTLKTELSWGGTSRSLPESVACVKLYQELIEVAAEVESIMKRENIVYVHGVPEVVVETPAVDVFNAANA